MALSETTITEDVDSLLDYVASERPSKMQVARAVRALRAKIASSDLDDDIKLSTDAALERLTRTLFAIEGAGPGQDIWRAIDRARGQ